MEVVATFRVRDIKAFEDLASEALPILVGESVARPKEPIRLAGVAPGDRGKASVKKVPLGRPFQDLVNGMIDGDFVDALVRAVASVHPQHEVLMLVEVVEDPEFGASYALFRARYSEAIADPRLILVGGGRR